MDSYPYLVDIDTYERHRAQVIADATDAARAAGYEPEGHPAIHVIVELPVRAAVTSTPARVA